MKDTTFTITEQFSSETPPDRDILRQEVTLWLTKALQLLCCTQKEV